MTTPAFLLGMVISLLYGAFFHLWRGGSFGRLILYLLLGLIGFWVGHFVAAYTKVTLFSLGPLHIGMATVFSWGFLLFGYWLSLLPNKSEKPEKQTRSK